MQMHSAVQRQSEFFDYLITCHDLWEQADGLVARGHHTGKCFERSAANLFMFMANLRFDKSFNIGMWINDTY